MYSVFSFVFLKACISIHTCKIPSDPHKELLTQVLPGNETRSLEKEGVSCFFLYSLSGGLIFFFIYCEHLFLMLRNKQQGFRLIM